MPDEESVSKLSRVLTNLQEISTDDRPVSRQALNIQVETLREVQSQMMTQLRLHDAQIAALQELIGMLSGGNRS